MVKGGVAKDLMKASGQVGLNKPFRAPVYRTYWECIRGLHKQGILGFYKGNGVRLAHHYFFSVAYIELLHQYSDDRSELFPKPSITKSLVAAGAVAFGLHSLHLAEARLVLQNRLPSFQTYPSIMNMAREQINTNPRGLLAGMPAYIATVPLLMLTQFSFASSSLQMLAL